MPSALDIDRALKEAEKEASPVAVGAPIGVGRPASVTAAWFANAPSPFQATRLDLSPGEERSRVDIQLGSAASGRVEGTVLFAGGVLPPNVVIALFATGFDGASAPDGFRSTRSDALGQFHLASVPPGEYLLFAQITLPKSRLLASERIVVDADSVTSMSLALRPPFRVTGRVQFAGDGPPPEDVGGWRVGFEPVAEPGGVTLSSYPVQVAADGTFTVADYAAGRYRVRSLIPPELADRWMVRSASLGGRDVLDEPFDLRGDTDGLVVTFTDRISQVQGTLHVPAGTAPSDYHVVLFPAAAALREPQSERIQAVRVSAEGGYAIRKIPSGTYLMAVTADVEPGEWMDPAFLQRLSPSALEISIAEGEQKVQDFQLGKR
jgi:hypothetical protein